MLTKSQGSSVNRRISNPFIPIPICSGYHAPGLYTTGQEPMRTKRGQQGQKRKKERKVPHGVQQRSRIALVFLLHNQRSWLRLQLKVSKVNTRKLLIAKISRQFRGIFSLGAMLTMTSGPISWPINIKIEHSHHRTVPTTNVQWTQAFSL